MKKYSKNLTLQAQVFENQSLEPLFKQSIELLVSGRLGFNNLIHFFEPDPLNIELTR